MEVVAYESITIVPWHVLADRITAVRDDEKYSRNAGGRIGILELYSLSKSEKEGLTFPNEMDFSLSCLLARQSLTKKTDIVDVYEHIWRGGMPDALQADAEQRQEYFNSYSMYLDLNHPVSDTTA